MDTSGQQAIATGGLFGSGCTLCQSPAAQQFLFITAFVLSFYVWYLIIEE